MVRKSQKEQLKNKWRRMTISPSLRSLKDSWNSEDSNTDSTRSSSTPTVSHARMTPFKQKLASIDEDSTSTSSKTHVKPFVMTTEWTDTRTSKEVICQLYKVWTPQLSPSYRPHVTYVPPPTRCPPTSKTSSRQSSLARFQLAVYTGRFKTAERVVETCNHFQKVGEQCAKRSR